MILHASGLMEPPGPAKYEPVLSPARDEDEESLDSEDEALTAASVRDAEAVWDGVQTITAGNKHCTFMHHLL